MTTLRKALTKQLLSITGVTEKIWPDRGDGFSSLIYKNKDFAHFHNDNEIDLRLTKTVRRQERTLNPVNSTYHPKRSANSPWVELRFNSTAELNEVVRLVKLAIEKI